MPIHQTSDWRKLPIMELSPTDMERATMKAATATAVRPRFWRMFPAAIFPEAREIRCSPHFKTGPRWIKVRPVKRLAPMSRAKELANPK